jgi:hypothetical protein
MGVDLDFFRAQRLAAREGEQAADEIGAAQRRVERVLDRLGVALVVRHVAFERIEIADDHAEQIVEIMRHAAREVADGFHLLGLAKLRLDGVPLGHVFDYEDDGADVAVGVAQGGAGRADIDQPTVARRPAQLYGLEPFSAPRPLEIEVEFALHWVRQHGAIIMSDHLLGREAEDPFGRFVPHQERRVHIHNGDRKGRRVEGRVNQIVRFAQPFLDALAFGDLRPQLFRQPGQARRPFIDSSFEFRIDLLERGGARQRERPRHERP